MLRFVLRRIVLGVPVLFTVATLTFFIMHWVPGGPFDTEKMTITSGIRLGSQAATTRGFGLNEFKKVGELITKVIEGLSKNPEDNSKIESEVRKEVVELCSRFLIYSHLLKN